MGDNSALQGLGSGQGQGACEKPSPRRWALPAPRSGLLFLLEGESVPPGATCAHLSLLAGPCPGAVLGGCPSWRTHFGTGVLPSCRAPCRDGGETVAGSHSASGSHPRPSHMGFSWVQTGLWHAEPRCELSIPAAVPQGAGTTGDRVPGWLTALLAPAIQGGQGQHKPGTLWEVRSPRAPLRCHPAAWHNAECEQGEPRCHFTPWLSPLPLRVHGDPQGGSQVRMSPLAGSGARGWGQRPRGPVLRHPHPTELLLPIPPYGRWPYF